VRRALPGFEAGSKSPGLLSLTGVAAISHEILVRLNVVADGTGMQESTAAQDDFVFV
jgi:hypothetical protein